MTSRRVSGVLLAVGTLAASQGRAREFLMPEERAERELRRKREAQPVLICTPGALRASAEKGKAAELTLTVRNAGGRTLEWRVNSAPEWLRIGERSGRLGFQQETTLRLVAEAESLSAGVVEGGVVIEAPGAAGSPARIAVSLRIRPEPERPAPEPREEAGPGERPEAKRRAERSDRRTPSPKAGREWAFGLRTGAFLPSSSEVADYNAVVLVGLYYRPKGLNDTRLGYELAVQVGSPSKGGVYESLPVSGSLNLLFPLIKGERRAKAYLLSGLGGLVESVTQKSTGDRHTNYAATLDLGAGLEFAGGRLDLRATWCFLLGSENIVGHGVVAAGYSF